MAVRCRRQRQTLNWTEKYPGREFYRCSACALLFAVTVVVSDVNVVTVVFILRTSMPEAERSIGEFWRIRRMSRGVSR